MRYSQSTELAIDSLLYMATRGDTTDFSVEQVAQAQGVSASYLAKVFQQLVKAGLLRSHRGAKGGYSIARSLAQITLKDVAVVFEGTSPLYDCHAGSRTCTFGPHCLISATFNAAERALQDVLASVSLQDVVNHAANQTPVWSKAAPNGPNGNGVAPVPAPLEAPRGEAAVQS
jgi:Rrf2 family protein